MLRPLIMLPILLEPNQLFQSTTPVVSHVLQPLFILLFNPNKSSILGKEEFYQTDQSIVIGDSGEIIRALGEWDAIYLFGTPTASIVSKLDSGWNYSYIIRVF